MWPSVMEIQSITHPELRPPRRQQLPGQPAPCDQRCGPAGGEALKQRFIVGLLGHVTAGLQVRYLGLLDNLEWLRLKFKSKGLIDRSYWSKCMYLFSFSEILLSIFAKREFEIIKISTKIVFYFNLLGYSQPTQKGLGESPSDEPRP